MVYDSKGEFIQQYIIPSRPPKPPLYFEEQPVPWWYANRGMLLAAVVFAAVVAFFRWIVSALRRRNAHTLSIIKDYL